MLGGYRVPPGGADMELHKDVGSAMESCCGIITLMALWHPPGPEGCPPLDEPAMLGHLLAVVRDQQVPIPS